MPIVSGGGGGGGGPAAGSYLPVANKAGVTVDTTTYDDTIKGSGKLTTLVFPAEQGALALAIAGDAFPRWILSCDPESYGLVFGGGTVDAANTIRGYISGSSSGTGVGVPLASQPVCAPQLLQVSPLLTITNTAPPTVQLVSGTAAQIHTTRDVETHTAVTFNPGVATTATCVVALSPNNIAYALLTTVTKPVGTVFDGEIEDVTCRVPAGWYLKLTVTNATLGLTTYY